MASCDYSFDPAIKTIGSTEARACILNVKETLKDCKTIEDAEKKFSRLRVLHTEVKEAFTEDEYAELNKIYDKNKSSLESLKSELRVFLNKILGNNPEIGVLPMRNEEQIDKLFGNPELATIFGVFDAERGENGNFIKNWEAKEEGSIPAFLHAFSTVVRGKDEAVTYDYFITVRKKLKYSENGFKYKYFSESNQTSIDENGFSKSCYVGCPNAFKFFCNYLTYMKGMNYFKDPPSMQAGNWFWKYLFYEKPEVYQLLKKEVLEPYEKIPITTFASGRVKLPIDARYDKVSERLEEILIEHGIVDTEESFATRVKARYDLPESLKLFYNNPYSFFKHLYGILYNNSLSSKEAREVFDKICSRYMQITKDPYSLTEDQKYEEVVTFVKAMDMMHFFADYNTRGPLLILNKELMRLGLPIMSLDNPNSIEWLSVQSLKELCKAGNAKVDSLLQHGRKNPYAPGISGTYEFGTHMMGYEERSKLRHEIEEAIGKI